MVVIFLFFYFLGHMERNYECMLVFYLGDMKFAFYLIYSVFAITKCPKNISSKSICKNFQSFLGTWLIRNVIILL